MDSFQNHGKKNGLQRAPFIGNTIISFWDHPSWTYFFKIHTEMIYRTHSNAKIFIFNKLIRVETYFVLSIKNMDTT